MFKSMKSDFKKQDITDLNSINQKKVTHYVYSVENLKIDFKILPIKIYGYNSYVKDVTQSKGE